MKLRLWKLGSLEHSIVPTKLAIQKLEAKVKELTKDEVDVINFVWGPDLEVQEFSDGGFALRAGSLKGFGTATDLSELYEKEDVETKPE